MEKDNSIKLHILHCGSITIPASMAYIEDSAFKRVTLPVSVYLIEHPVHGKILVETGLSPEGCELLPRYLREFYRPHIEKGQTAIEQLAAMGISPEDIDLLLITHNDVDHTCAVGDFAGKAKRIVMAEHEYYWSCRTVYRVRQVWDTFMPYKDMIDRPFYYGTVQGPIGRGFDLFGDDSVLCIACPGHTDGQMAVMVNKAPSGRFVNAASGIYGNEFFVLASDVAFSQRNIDDLVIPGYGFARKRQLKSIRWLREVQADPQCVGVFCSHDPDIEPQTIII
ncbi:MAG: N-acyl homoserine lactonase family protein [Oscillospiraceae bacterium]|nr:N-acyl homoserine lactonase family protein [Oscillospiraceae bacterium]